MKRKPGQPDATVNSMPFQSSPHKPDSESVEARRNKLKRIFAMMSNVNNPGNLINPNPNEDGRARCAGSGALARPTTQATYSMDHHVATTQCDGLAFSARSMAQSMKSSTILPETLAEHNHATQSIEITLSKMSQTLKALLCHLDFSQNKALPESIENLIEKSYQNYLKHLTEPKEKTGLASLSDPLFVTGEGKDSLDWRLKLQRARTAAADEVYSLEQSVADYAAAPPMPSESIVTSSRDILSLEMETIGDGLKKIRECTTSITELYNNVSLPWWSSPLRTRDMKIATIRLNYHARRALLWDWRCHNQLLIRATQLNELTNSNSVELIKLQQNMHMFLDWIERSKANTAALTKETFGLQEQLRELEKRDAELQEALVEHCRELSLVSLHFSSSLNASYKNDESEENDILRETTSNALAAELVLLLMKYTWPEELHEDVERVKKWLHVVPTVLE